MEIKTIDGVKYIEKITLVDASKRLAVLEKEKARLNDMINKINAEISELKSSGIEVPK